MQRCGIIGVRGLEGQTRGLIFAVLRGSLIFEALCYCPLQATWDIPGGSLSYLHAVFLISVSLREKDSKSRERVWEVGT